MEKIDWSKVSIEAAGNVGIGNPYPTPKLDIGGYSEILEPKLDTNKEWNVGGTNNPRNPLVIRCNGNVGMSCKNPNHKIKIN